MDKRSFIINLLLLITFLGNECVGDENFPSELKSMIYPLHENLTPSTKAEQEKKCSQIRDSKLFCNSWDSCACIKTESASPFKAVAAGTNEPLGFVDGGEYMIFNYEVRGNGEKTVITGQHHQPGENVWVVSYFDVGQDSQKWRATKYDKGFRLASLGWRNCDNHWGIGSAIADKTIRTFATDICDDVLWITEPVPNSNNEIFIKHVKKGLYMKSQGGERSAAESMYLVSAEVAKTDVMCRWYLKKLN